MEFKKNINLTKKLPPSNAMKEIILNIKEPTVIHGGVLEWELLKWDLKDWSIAFDNSKLPFRVGKKKCSKVSLFITFWN